MLPPGPSEVTPLGMGGGDLVVTRKGGWPAWVVGWGSLLAGGEVERIQED